MESRYQNILTELAGKRGGPCLSMYLTTAAGKNGCDETILRFKNLKRKALKSLNRGYDDSVVHQFTDRLERIEHDTEFWSYQTGGLAVFMTPTYERLEKLRRKVDDEVVVADRFYIKPLMYLFQTLDQFLVLAVSMNHVKLYVGDRDRLEAETINELNLAYNQFWGEPNVDRRMAALSVAGHSAPNGKSRALFHNYDDVHARRKIDLSRYFAAIDDVVCKALSGGSSLPVVLAALPEHQDLYRAHSHIKHLLPKGILGNPDVMSVGDLRDKAWSIIKPHYEFICQQLVSEYSSAAVTGRASDQLHQIAKALSQGRVGKLLIEKNRIIPGKFVADPGVVLFADINNPHINDLLDDFADVVEQNSGTVTVLAKDKMPTDTGVAAIYRY
jgi:hypothetical protein